MKNKKYHPIGTIIILIKNYFIQSVTKSIIIEQNSPEMSYGVSDFTLNFRKHCCGMNQYYFNSNNKILHVSFILFSGLMVFMLSFSKFSDTCIYRDLLVEESMNRYNKLTGETPNIA